jgi:hypothetical protein
MADFGRGIKAGVVTGIVYIIISVILGATGYKSGYLWDFISAAGLGTAVGLTINSFIHELLFQYAVRGIIFGVVFATLYSFLPGTASVKKGVVLSSFLWIVTVINVMYLNPGWPWAPHSNEFVGTHYGGVVSLASPSLALVSIVSALVFGALTGFLWDTFRGKELTEERKGSSVLPVSFILAGIIWALWAAMFLLAMVTGAIPPIEPQFWWFNLLNALVVFIGPFGWVLALVAWRKTKRGESGFKWGMYGGVIMALTGIMLLPGALAITGGVLSRRKRVSEASTAEAIAGDKIARSGEQKMRTNINRSLILLISSMAMLTVTIIVGCMTPTATATYTPITLDQYSSTVISRYGLSLTLSLNSTTYHPGEQISVAIHEKNNLPIENNIHVANGWPVQGLSLSPCGTLGYPFGISILQGYYDAKSVVAITPLQLFDPNACYSCPAPVGIVSYDFQPWSDIAAAYTIYDQSALYSWPSIFGIDSWNFQPWSDIAATYIILNDGPSLSINMNNGITSAGFWTGSRPNATFSNFTPGIYTVIGGDEWGALVILHFTIS